MLQEKEVMEEWDARDGRRAAKKEGKGAQQLLADRQLGSSVSAPLLT